MADQTISPLPDGAGTKIHKTLYKTTRNALAFATGDTVKSFTLNATANAIFAIFEMPTFSGAAVTGTISIENSDGTEVYANGSVAEGATDLAAISIPLVGANTIKVTLSTNPLSSGTCYVTFYLEGR